MPPIASLGGSARAGKAASETVIANAVRKAKTINTCSRRADAASGPPAGKSSASVLPAEASGLAEIGFFAMEREIEAASFRGLIHLHRRYLVDQPEHRVSEAE